MELVPDICVVCMKLNVFLKVVYFPLCHKTELELLRCHQHVSTYKSNDDIISQSKHGSFMYASIFLLVVHYGTVVSLS